LAGFGFIGKNTLLVTEDYGCAVVLGKVLTTAPFTTGNAQPGEPQCGDCSVCADVCPTKALSGKLWSLGTSRDEMLKRKLCAPCLLCMVNCPYTVRYMES
jgi:epoxyqueuosine reductase QueG